MEAGTGTLGSVEDIGTAGYLLKTQYLLKQQQRFFKYAQDNQHKLTYLALLQSSISLGVSFLCNFMSRVRKKQI